MAKIEQKFIDIIATKQSAKMTPSGLSYYTANAEYLSSDQIDEFIRQAGWSVKQIIPINNVLAVGDIVLIAIAWLERTVEDRPQLQIPTLGIEAISDGNPTTSQIMKIINSVILKVASMQGGTRNLPTYLHQTSLKRNGIRRRTYVVPGAYWEHGEFRCRGGGSLWDLTTSIDKCEYFPIGIKEMLVGTSPFFKSRSTLNVRLSNATPGIVVEYNED